MSPLLDDILVAAALVASAGYALFALGPRTWRRGALSRVAGWAAHMPAWSGLRALATRLGAAAAKSPGACGGCDSCGSEGEAAPTVDQSEIKVPLTRIGRRR
jgi:hypothetical protein